MGPQLPRADPPLQPALSRLWGPFLGRPFHPPAGGGSLSGQLWGIGALTQSFGNCGQCPGCSPAGAWHTHREWMRPKGLGLLPLDDSSLTRPWASAELLPQLAASTF